MKDKIKKVLIERSIMELPLSLSGGYANGYVGMPPEHPWFGKYYTNLDVSIHGGLTYSNPYLPNNIYDTTLWWIGFDTSHYGDTIITCNRTYCENELKSLYNQVVVAIPGIYCIYVDTICPKL
jgi:hypothetical protein